MPNVSIHGHQFGRWVDLQSVYTVRAAFAVLRGAGRWECCRARDMRVALQAVECQARVAGRLPALSGEATPRPASCGADATTQPPVQPRQRAASVAGDGRSNRHITVQLVVNAVLAGSPGLLAVGWHFSQQLVSSV